MQEIITTKTPRHEEKFNSFNVEENGFLGRGSKSFAYYPWCLCCFARFHTAFVVKDF